MEKQAIIADTAMQALRKQLTQKVKILDYSFTETSRKRKYDLTAALGPNFKAYAHEEASDESGVKTEFLFTEATMKKMSKDLANVKTGGGSKSQNNSNFSKNGSSSGKTQRSGNNYQGNNYNPNYGNQKKSYNGSNSYNNSNNSQNYNSKFKGKKHNNNKN